MFLVYPHSLNHDGQAQVKPTPWLYMQTLSVVPKEHNTAQIRTSLGVDSLTGYLALIGLSVSILLNVHAETQQQLCDSKLASPAGNKPRYMV